MIRIQRIRLGGIVSLDIRRCKETKGEPIPTKTGISIALEDVEMLLKTIQGVDGTATYFDENKR